MVGSSERDQIKSPATLVIGGLTGVLVHLPLL